MKDDFYSRFQFEKNRFWNQEKKEFLTQRKTINVHGKSAAQLKDMHIRAASPQIVHYRICNGRPNVPQQSTFVYRTHSTDNAHTTQRNSVHESNAIATISMPFFCIIINVRIGKEPERKTMREKRFQ